MRFIFISFLMVVIFIGPAFAHSETTVEKVHDNIHLIVSPKGGNVVVSAGEDGVFLIDDQLKLRDSIIKETIKTISDKDIKFILNTHYHFDHTGGNELFGEEGAVLVAHDNVRKRLSTKQVITYFKREMEPLSKAGLPVVTFDDDVTFHFNGDAVHMIHVKNAHTDGDAIAHFKEANVIAAGDTVFNGFYPFIDVEHGGSIRGVVKAADTILSLSNSQTRIVPGHGPVMSVGELKKYRDMLEAIANNVEAGIKAGKNKEQVVADKPTQEFDAQVSKGIVSPDAFAEIIFDDLSR